MPVINLAPNTNTGMYSTGSSRTGPLVTYAMSTIYVNSGDLVTGYENGSTFIMGRGTETIDAWLTSTTIYGGSGMDRVTQTAPMGGLTFIGGSGTNIIDGGNNCVLYGGTGKSTLIGGDNSLLVGQSGKELFEMEHLTDHVHISSFMHGVDKLGLHTSLADAKDVVAHQHYENGVISFAGSVVPNLQFVSAVSSISLSDIKLIQ